MKTEPKTAAAITHEPDVKAKEGLEIQHPSKRDSRFFSSRTSANTALLIAVAVYLLFGIVATSYISSRTQDTSIEATKASSETLVNRATDSILPANEKIISLSQLDEQVLRDFSSQFRLGNIFSVAVTDVTGKIIATELSDDVSFDDKQLNLALSGTVTTSKGKTADSRIIYVPVSQDKGKIIGVVILNYNWSIIMETAIRTNRLVWGGILASAFVVSAVLWLIFRAFNREIRRRYRSLASILDYAPIGIYTVDTKGVIDSINPKMLSIAGLKSADQIIGSNVFEMTSYKQSGLDRYFERGLKGVPFEREVEYVSLIAGKRSWRHYRGIPLFQPDGRTIDRLLLLVEDITNQKTLEEKNIKYSKQLENFAWERTRQLAQTEDRMRNIINNIPVIVWAMDANGVFTVNTGSGLQRIGRKDNEVVGKSFLDIYAKFPDIIANLTKALAGEKVTFSTAFKNRHFQVICIPDIDDAGSVKGMSGLSIDVTDQVKTERMFTEMINISPNMTTLLDAKGNILFESSTVTQVIGYMPKEAVGMNMIDIVHPEDYGKLKKTLEDVVANPTIQYRSVIRLRHKLGQWIPVEIVGQSHLDNPFIEAIVVNSHDISNRVKYEEELHQSIATEKAMSNISAAFTTKPVISEAIQTALTEIGTNLKADTAFYAALSVTTGHRSINEWNSGGRTGLSQAITAALGKFPDWMEELKKQNVICLKNASELPDSDHKRSFLVESGIVGTVMIYPVFDSKNLVGALGIITEEASPGSASCESRLLRLAAETIGAALQRERAFQMANLHAEHQSAIAELGQSIITEGNPKNLMMSTANTLKKLLEVNTVGFFRYRSSSDDFLLVDGIGWPDPDLGTASISNGINSQAGFTLLTRQSTFSNDYAAETRFVPSRLLMSTGAKSGACAIVGNFREPWGVISVASTSREFTATDMEILEAVAHLVSLGLNKITSDARVRDLDQLKSKFIQVVSHQFRTPLSAARWNLESILNGEVGEISPEMRQFIRITYDANTEVITRIHDLLTVLDIEESRIVLSPEPVSLESLVGSTINELRKKTDLRKLKLEYEQPKKPLPAMNLDQTRIRSAIEKVLDNALTYTPAQGVIKVKVSSDSEMAHIEVEDNGAGIPESEQNRIFERFYRASNASTIKPDASGLGLTIAKHFVTSHGGDITFVSTEGKGSTFRITLPLKGVTA